MPPAKTQNMKVNVPNFVSGILVVSMLLHITQAKNEADILPQPHQQRSRHQKRQIYREQVLPHAGGKIPDSAFQTDRLALNRLQKEGIAVPDGVLLEQRSPQVFPDTKKSLRPVYTVKQTDDQRYTSAEGQYSAHAAPPSVDTTYLLPQIAHHAVIVPRVPMDPILHRIELPNGLLKGGHPQIRAKYASLMLQQQKKPELYAEPELPKLDQFSELQYQLQRQQFVKMLQLQQQSKHSTKQHYVRKEQPSLQLPTVLASMYPTYIRDPGTAWSQFPHVQPRPQMDPRTFVLWTPSPSKHGSSQPLAATHSPLLPTWDFSLPPHNYQSSNLIFGDSGSFYDSSPNYGFARRDPYYYSSQIYQS